MTNRPQEPGTKPPLAPDQDSASQTDRASALEPDVPGLEGVDRGRVGEDLQEQPDEKPNAPNRDVDTAAAVPDPHADPWGASDDGADAGSES